MKITKFQHACLQVEDGPTTLLIDLGEFTRDFIPPKKLDAIILTHEHPDHFDERRVRSLLADHPKAMLIAPQSITARFTDHLTTTSTPNAIIPIGASTIRCIGGTHAPIVPGLPAPENFGVLVNDYLYYPGDSFALPEIPTVAVLALPISAPWLKVSDALSFLVTLKPAFVFPTHDGMLSDDGKKSIDALVQRAANLSGSTYRRLDSSRIVLS